jgi:hypothetical protein
MNLSEFFYSIILQSFKGTSVKVPTPYGPIRVLFKIRFRVEFFDFRISA